MKQTELQVKSTPFFKLNKKLGKHLQAIDLRKQFGFVPETIIIERMSGRNNVIRVVALIPEKKTKNKPFVVKNE